MATFPSIEASYGVTKNSAPNTRIIRFADGYEHRLLFGLAEHQNPKVWNLGWNNITETQSDIIENFLDERANAAGVSGDSDAFDYTPPGESLSSKYVCETWQKTINIPNRATITATFREVFEP